ncbi:MAG: FeoB-associated Cys-rich membrane protein [Candidatus Anaerobiospirillum merdipullorum]|uniref:FeoB-associated Cys-rich membrane protein n=1 Tax=Candidatus Anaerobiospirillum merdipullorum TaxID=2838450 RepID=A0A9E2NRK7_9GAMM|nr:FeoB-associated Cys-rich membrane protein [Candidatus Anaerobiospirillum merdipullorum]
MLDWILGTLLVIAVGAALYAILRNKGGGCSGACGKDCRQCAASMGRKRTPRSRR